MKYIYILQNSQLSFDMDISKIYCPEKYLLLLIVNEFGLKKLVEKNQQRYFKKIWETENFDFINLKNIISEHNKNNHSSFQIVTNAEEAVDVCGRLRFFFETDCMNYDRFKNKITMKNLLIGKEILIPNHILFNKYLFNSNPILFINTVKNKMMFPLIAKPTNLMSCINVRKINTDEELIKWCHSAAISDIDFEIEEFINGKHYTCDSFIKDSKIIFTQISECSNSCYDFLCGLTKGTIALPHNDRIYKLLCSYTNLIHNAIKPPVAGVTHLEIILTTDNKIYFIEIGHRSPGLLIPEMYKKFLGIDTIESHILLQINKNFEIKIQKSKYCAWLAFPTKEGVLKTQHKPTINSEYILEWNKKVSEHMSNPLCGRDYAGKILLWNSDHHQLKNDFYYLNEYNFYDLES